MRGWRFARKILIEAERKYDEKIRARWAHWNWLLAIGAFFSPVGVAHFKQEREAKHKEVLATSYAEARKRIFEGRRVK